MQPTPTKAPSPGEVVAGRYRIEDLLGKGGFGAVFRATQLNLGRTVALKVLLPDLVAQDEGMIRFQREAQLAQRLEHPNTVRLLDFGQSEGGVPFIAFELLKGQPLDEVLRNARSLPAQRVARITSQVLKSLMEAHERGIVHRDIKPSNIFLCDFSGEPDFVKVLDFGIAKPIAGPGQTAAGLTRQGVAIGTPHYMAPEQVAGTAVGPPADLYALGLVMAELLTGEIVFKGNSALQICMDQLSPAPVPHPPQVLQSPLGPVIHRATQKPVERRYASASEMLEHLESIVRQQGGDPGRPSAASMPQNAPAVAYAATGVVGPGAGALYPMSPPMQPPMAPAGYGYAPAPPIPAPFPAPFAPAVAPPKTGRSGCGVAAIIGGVAALLVGLMACGAFFYFFGDRSSVTTSSTSGGRSVARGALRDLTGPKIRERLESLGYSIIGESTSNQATLNMNQFTVQRTPQSGAVMLYRFTDESIAKATEDSLRNNANAAVVRDGGTILFVVMSPTSASREVLDAVIR